jgi:FKBP-type peptidyl-prolyl cis-trans isomerase
VPVSRQRKIVRAKKRPRVVSASTSPLAAHRPGRKKFNVKILVIVLIVAVAAAAVVYVVANRNGLAGSEVTTQSGLKYTDLKVGDGATPRTGQGVSVHYIGWLESGREFNNSYKLGRPAEFELGPGLIPGWNEALQTMKVGGKRRIILPPKLAYGVAGKPPDIPPNATLTFEIELLGVK